MPTLTLGDRTLDLTDEILVLDAADVAAADGLVRAGAVDLGMADEESLAALRERSASVASRPTAVLMMRFGADQLAELAIAIIRGVRIARAADTDNATKVATLLAALLAASHAKPGGADGPGARRR